MPNPPVHRPPSGPQIPPPDVAGLWQVYFLRHRGHKLNQADVLRTAKRGVLTFTAPQPEIGLAGGALWLREPRERTVLGYLEAAQLVEATERGMLFRGRDFLPARSKDLPGSSPQAWWCMLAGTLPLDHVVPDYRPKKNPPAAG